MKNPYNLIEKANETFNLYLNKYSEIEKYMESSKIEQNEIKILFNSFLEQYNSQQDNNKEINENFLELLQKLIDEDKINKKMINELKYQFKELNSNQKIITDSINDLNTKINNIDNFINITSNNLNNELNINFNEIKKSIFQNDNLINAESEKQLNEIKTLNEKINTESNKQLNEIKQINENQKNIQQILNSYNDMNNKLNDAIDLFVLNYEECKKSFFNDNEYILKNYLDTDDLFRTCYFNNIQFLSYSPLENKILLKTKEGIILSTNNRFYTIKEVIGFDGYSVPQLYQFDDFVVFDIGMNRAYASLRFAEFNNCSAVYGFEIDEDTYYKAIYNMNLNPDLSKKITPYNFGLSNSNEEMKLYYIEGADGVNTVESDLVKIQYEMKENPDKIKTKSVQVKKTSEIIENIIKSEKINSKIVLKIDTEGSEYNIIDDLIESGLIYKMDLILGEGHKFNNRNLSKELLKLGFKEIERKDHKIVYSFAFVKDEFYDIWPLKI